MSHALTRAAAVAFAVALAGGCHTCSREVRQAFALPAPAPSPELATQYAVAPADVLAVTLPNRTLTAAVLPDGGVDLPGFGHVEAAGATAPEFAAALAVRLGVSTQAVSVSVSEFRSRSLLLTSPGGVLQRSLDYRGPERVSAVLRRAGGLGDATLDAVYLVRPRVADGRRPEVVPVDLEAAVVRGDAAGDPVVEPGDQIAVGVTRRARVKR